MAQDGAVELFVVGAGVGGHDQLGESGDCFRRHGDGGGVVELLEESIRDGGEVGGRLPEICISLFLLV